MVRHEQYYCTATWTTYKDAEFDSNGFPIDDGSKETFTAKCRYEAFKKGEFKEYSNKDGDAVYSTGALYFKRGQTFPKRFDVLTVDVHNIKLEVLHAFKGLFNYTTFTHEVL